MSLPQLLANALGDESVVAEVSLGGEDRLVVTPTRTVVYRAEGLLSEESTTSYPHDVERLTLSVGRRKATFTLEYGLEGTETLSVPAGRVDAVLHPVMAGILSAMDVTDAGEAVRKTFRFSDLTLVITSQRVVKHIGSAVWSTEYETFAYEDLTNLGFEEGSVATTIVLTHDGRQERLKAPNNDARAVRETLVEAVCSYHDVTSLEEFRSRFDVERDDADDVDRFDFGDGPDPLSAEPTGETDASSAATEPEAAETSTTGSSTAVATEPAGTSLSPTVDTVGGEAGDETPAGATTTESTSDGTTADGATSGGTTADGATSDGTADEEAAGNGTTGAETATSDDDALAARVDRLAEAVDRQEAELARQADLLETLIEELRRGR